MLITSFSNCRLSSHLISLLVLLESVKKSATVTVDYDLVAFFFSCFNLVNMYSPIQDYVHPDDHAQITYEITPRFKLFTDKYYHAINKTTNK